MHRFFITYTAIVLSILIGSLSYAFLRFDDATISMLGTEYGVIENLTAGMFGLVAIVAFVILCERKSEIWALFTGFMTLAMLREMDAHKAFTMDSVLKIKFYVRDDVPMNEKIMGAIFVFLLVLMVIRLARYALPWVKNIIKFQHVALSVFMGLGILVFAKTLDAMKRIIPPLADFHDTNAHALGLFEETFELVGAMMFLLVCLLSLKAHRAS